MPRPVRSSTAASMLLTTKFRIVNDAGECWSPFGYANTVPPPGWCARGIARQIIERSAHANSDRNPERCKVAVEPVLLFWCAVRDQEHVHPASLLDRDARCGIVVWVRGAWHRASDLQAWELAL